MYFLLGMTVWDISLSMTCGCFLNLRRCDGDAPLMLFTIGANDLPLNVLGFCQYISPFYHALLLLGYSFSGEPFTTECLLFFYLSTLAVFTIADWRKGSF